MEAVPKLPMLSFEIKVSTDNGDFAERLKHLIRARYGEEPATFSKEISELETLRAQSCIRPSLDTTGTDTIKKYYSQLNFLKNRFEIQDGMFNFSWHDCYLGVVCHYSDLDYELASVLYNSGAVHSILGARESRNSSEEMKVACTHFQCAAWAFHTVPDRYPKQMGSDMSTDLLAFLAQVCLAQAQECILEKSILDHRKATIIGKVCVQVAEYYRAALKKIEHSNSRNEDESISESVGDKKSKSWTRYVEFKMNYFMAIAYFFTGIQSEESQQMGERVAYFQAASDQLNSTSKLAKNVDNVDKRLISNCLTFTSDVINGKLDNAKKENEFVFHEKVPEFDSLPELKGASLVKGLGFDITDPNVSGPDIFARLVPMATHEASSLYSEEKAKILRTIGEEISNKDDLLDTFMSSLHLDEIPSPGDQLSLPQELIECAAALSVKTGAIDQLKEAMSKIASVSSDVQSSLNEIKELLKVEEEEEKSFQEIFGKREVSKAISDLESELEKYDDAHRMASESNLTLHNAIQLHLDNLTLLSKPLDELQSEIPSMADLDDESEANIAEVRRILAKVNEMTVQRNQLATKLRNDIHNDDITKKLIVESKDADEMEKVFKNELGKFDGQLKVLRQNLVAQDNILRALTESNADFAETRRNVSELMTARQMQIDQLIESYHAYEDLLFKAAKGLEFYDKLSTNVCKLLDNTQEKSRLLQEARDAKLATRAPQPPMQYPTAPASGGSPSCPLPTAQHSNHQVIQSVPQKLTLKQVLDQRKRAQEGRNESVASAPEAPPSPVKAMNNNPMLDPGLQHYQAYMYQQQQQGNIPTNSRSSQNPTPQPSPAPAAYASPVFMSQPSSVMGQSSVLASAPQSSAINNQGQGHPVQTPPNLQGISHQQSMTSHMPHQPQNVNVIPQGLTIQVPYGITQTMASPIPYSMAPNLQQQHQQPRINTGPQSLASQMPQQQSMNFTPQSMPSSVPQGLASQMPQQQQRMNFIPQSIASSVPNSMAQNIPQQQMQMNYIPQSMASRVPNSMAHSMASQVPNSMPSQIQYSMAQNIPHHNQQQRMNFVPQTVANGSPNSMAHNVPQQPRMNCIPQHHFNASQMTPQGNSSHQMSQPQTFPVGQVQQQFSSGQQVPNSFGPSIGHQPQHRMPLQQHQPQQLQQQLQQQHQQHQQQPLQQQQQQQLGFHYMQQHQQPIQSGQQPNMMTRPQQQSQGMQQPIAMMRHQYPYVQQQQQQQPNYAGRQQPVSNEGQQQTFNQQNNGQFGMQVPQQNQPPQQHANNVVGPNSPQVHLGYMQQQQVRPIPYSVQSTSTVTTCSAHETVVHSRAATGANSSVTYNGQQPPHVAPYYAHGPGAQHYQQNTNGFVPISTPVPQTPIQRPIVPQPMGSSSASATPVVPPSPAPSAASLEVSDINNKVHKRQSSVDILVRELDQSAISTPTQVLVPKILTASEVEEQKKEHQASEEIAKASAKNPYEDSNALQRLLSEFQGLEKLVEQIVTDKTTLDTLWKSLNAKIEEEPKYGTSISVARCYPMKNRMQDVLPYDQTRVELPTTKDDYINASHVKDLGSHSPRFIATQAPPSNTLKDFWIMIFQEKVETMVCLLSLADLGEVYWPQDRKTPLSIGELEVNLQGVKVEKYWTESTLTVRNAKTNMSQVTIHLQLNDYSLPSIVNLMEKMLDYHRQQRNLIHPVLVHCLGGAGKTALALMLSATLAEIDICPLENKIVPDLTFVGAQISKQRKGVLKDKEHFKLAYQGTLLYMRQILEKHGLVQPEPIKKTINTPTTARRESADMMDSSSTTPTPVSTSSGVGRNTPDLSKLVDMNLSLEANTKKKEKITKQDFTNPKKKNMDPNDPLSQLDPFWSLK